MAVHLELMGQLKDQAERKKTTLEESEKKMKELTEEKNQMADELVPVLDRLKEIAKIEDDLVALKEELGEASCLLDAAS